MVEQIFYWTGVIIWWCFCIGFGGVVAITFLYLPIYFFKISKKRAWRWRLYAEIAETNFTNEELLDISYKIPLPPTIRISDLMNWFDKIQVEGKRVLKNKELNVE